MSLSKGTMLVMGLAIGLVSGAATLAIVQAPSMDVISKPVTIKASSSIRRASTSLKGLARRATH